MRGWRTTLSALCLLTGVGILLQWIAVWAGEFPVVDEVPGFRNYFLSFAVADMWLVLSALLAGFFALKRDPRAVLFGVALGSAMLFFGLYAMLYDFNTGLLFELSAGEIFGKAVTVYNIVGGIVVMLLSWKGREGRAV